MSDPIERWLDRTLPGLAVPYTRWRVPVIALTAVGATLIVVAGAMLLWMVNVFGGATLPPVHTLRVPEATTVVDAEGREVGPLVLGAVHRNVALEDLPDHVWRAVLAAEDRGFYDHAGYSLPGIARAFFANLVAGEIEQGGSTITQQYIDVSVDGIGRSYEDKIREVAMARQLEDRLTKDEILERYLNAVPLGRTAVGIEAGARIYFGVPATDLDVNQAATLAGMLAAPSAFDPATNPQAADRRRTDTLAAMTDEGWLADGEAEALIAAGLPDIRQDPLVSFGPTSYFMDAVRHEIRRLLPDHPDPSADLVIETTMDLRMQELAQATLREALHDTPHSGAIVSVDPATGAVRALVGGPDFATQEFNTAIQAHRQVGSAFKAFTLATFVAQGNDPASRFPAPRTYTVETPSGPHEVSNFSDRGYGGVSVRRATTNSINTAYMNLVDEVGPSQVVETAHRLGITSQLPPVPSVTLGTGSVRPLEMASAFATLADRGEHRPAHLVTRVTNHEGEVLFEHQIEDRRALDANIADTVTDVLRDVVEEGTGTAAALDEHPVAGKTGTTDDYRDAWFVGYVRQLATAVWIGNLDNTPMAGRMTGGSLPARTWNAYMQDAVAPLQPIEFQEPDTSELEYVNKAPRPPPPPAPTPSATPTHGTRDEPDPTQLPQLVPPPVPPSWEPSPPAEYGSPPAEYESPPAEYGSSPAEYESPTG